MPGRKNKAGPKGGKQGSKEAVGESEVLKTCRSLLKAYTKLCAGSTASQKICRDCKQAIDTETPLTKFVLELEQQSAVKSKNPPVHSEAVLPHADSDASAAPGAVSLLEPPLHPPLRLQPVVEAWTELRYQHMRALHIWSLCLSEDAIVTLALYFESRLGVHLKVLELRDTSLSPWSINRLARSLQKAQLTTLNLDYNIVPVASLAVLCACLQASPLLQSLSLNFCQLDSQCGELLGTLAALLAPLRQLSLAGNSLGCDGVTELLRPLVALSEADPAREPSTAATAAALLGKLFLQDNCVDVHCEVGGPFAPIICMRALKRWIVASPALEEVDLDGNAIGDGGGREVMLALQERKSAGLPAMRVTVSARMSADIYSAISELGTGGKKTKGKKNKGKRKGKKT